MVYKNWYHTLYIWPMDCLFKWNCWHIFSWFRTFCCYRVYFSFTLLSENFFLPLIINPFNAFGCYHYSHLYPSNHSATKYTILTINTVKMIVQSSSIKKLADKPKLGLSASFQFLTS